MFIDIQSYFNSFFSCFTYYRNFPSWLFRGPRPQGFISEFYSSRDKLWIYWVSRRTADGFVVRKGMVEQKRQSTKRFFITITLVRSSVDIAAVDQKWQEKKLNRFYSDQMCDLFLLFFTILIARQVIIPRYLSLIRYFGSI